VSQRKGTSSKKVSTGGTIIGHVRKGTEGGGDLRSGQPIRDYGRYVPSERGQGQWVQKVGMVRERIKYDTQGIGCGRNRTQYRYITARRLAGFRKRGGKMQSQKKKKGGGGERKGGDK